MANNKSAVNTFLHKRRNQMNRTIIYARVSTDRQDYERQQIELRQYAQAMGLNVVAEYTEKESGLHDERPEFQKLLQLTKADVDNILIWELSRLSRKASTMLKTVEDFTDKGVCIISKKEGIRTLEEDGTHNTQSDLYLGIYAAIAQNEVNTIKERMYSGRRASMKRRNLWTTKLPRGYKMEDGVVVIDEPEAENVRKIFELRAAGHSIRAVGKVFGMAIGTVDRILRNEAYKGVAHSRVYDGDIQTPQIVDVEVWDKVNGGPEVRKYQRRELSPTGYLRGKIVCPCCGGNVHLTYNGRDYICSMKTRKDLQHVRFAAIFNAKQGHDCIRKAIESYKHTSRTQKKPVETPDTIQTYISMLEEKQRDTARKLMILERSNAAVLDLLTEAEKNDYYRQKHNLEIALDNLDLEIQVQQRKLTQATVEYSESLNIAWQDFVESKSTDNNWYDVIKEIRFPETRGRWKKVEIETVFGDIIETEFEPVRGQSV